MTMKDAQSMNAQKDSIGKGYDAEALLGEEKPRRAFDMCMVLNYKTRKTVAFEDQNEIQVMENRQLEQPRAEEKAKMEQWKEQREGILKSLLNCGLELYCYYNRDRNEIIVKIGASAAKLRDTAARCKYKLQLKKQYLNAYAEYRHDFQGTREKQYKDRRIVSHIYRTHVEEDYPNSDAIFRTVDKIFLINHIITSKDKDCAGINVGNLLHEGQLKDYFPLHEAHLMTHIKGTTFQDRLRWFWMGEEHANLIRDYFGDKIAFYFLFMAFYWKWLVPLAAVGLLIGFVDSVAGSPDNITAIPFCILMSVWAIFMPYFWRRQESKYAIGWGTLDMASALEDCRPEHHGEMRINPVTAQVEPYYPWERRVWRYLFSGSVIILAGAMMILLILYLVWSRHMMQYQVHGGILTFEIATAAYVEISNALLTWLSRKLTDLENHRTQTEHETHMLAKVMGFKFVNTYLVLYYIAFFKQYANLFGAQMQCLRGDCFVDLQGQLFVFVVFRFTVSNATQWLLPKLGLWLRTLYIDKKSCQAYLHGHTLLTLADMSPAEVQAKKPKYDCFNDFDETLINHGFATLFAVASPWVCAATLLVTLSEMYLDSYGLIESMQRPLPIRAQSNEPWTTAFDIYGWLAASTNIILLIFSSHQYESWTLTEKLTLFLYLEHTLLFARLLLKVIFPAIPRNVELLQLKQENMVHRCLEDIKVEQHQDFSMFREEKHANIEVFEHDYLDDDEDPEPSLSLRDSANTLYDGAMEEARRLTRGKRNAPPRR
jgi:hypothetical protein